MSTALEVVKQEAPAVAVRPDQLDFSPAQVELLKDTVCKGATDDELKLFVQVCRSKQLNPFAKQIHAVKRWDSTLRREVMSYQTGIDGFRLIAERTGKYEGQDDPLWCGEDGAWKDVWLSLKPPVAAKATVYRRGFTKPMSRIALYREYVQTNREGQPNSMWSKMAANQLHKCAEALALRAAFPEDLAGLYTNDEMGQADNTAGIDTGGHPVGTQAAADHVAQQTIARQQEERRKRQASTQEQTQQERPQQEQPPQSKDEVPLPVREMWSRMVGIKGTTEVFAELKRDLAETIGDEAAGRFYYGVLGRQGVEHANQFKSAKPARVAAREIYECIAAAKMPPAVDASALPDDWPQEPAQ